MTVKGIPRQLTEAGLDTKILTGMLRAAPLYPVLLKVELTMLH